MKIFLILLAIFIQSHTQNIIAKYDLKNQKSIKNSFRLQNINTSPLKKARSYWPQSPKLNSVYAKKWQFKSSLVFKPMKIYSYYKVFRIYKIKIQRKKLNCYHKNAKSLAKTQNILKTKNSCDTPAKNSSFISSKSGVEPFPRGSCKSF